jgi:hypothetical protein
MLRSIGGIVLFMMAILWLPVWVQIAVCIIAIILIPYRFFLVLPAIFSDALYAPTAHFSLTAHWMTLTVLALLGIHYGIIKKMRIRTAYGLEA